MIFRQCEFCGAYLDPCEKCDCMEAKSLKRFIISAKKKHFAKAKCFSVNS